MVDSRQFFFKGTVSRDSEWDEPMEQ
jgi:hypothetical protein